METNNLINLGNEENLILCRYAYFAHLLGDPLKYLDEEYKYSCRNIDFNWDDFEKRFPYLNLYTRTKLTNNSERVSSNNPKEPYDYNEVEADDEEIRLYSHPNSHIVIIRKNNYDEDKQVFIYVLSLLSGNYKKYVDYIDSLDTYVKPQKKKFNMVTEAPTGGLRLRSFDIKQEAMPLESHYNDEVLGFYDHITSEFNEKDKGITLLHGPPGTGKTSFIRRLIAESNKKCIYLPPDLISHIATPSFATFMFDHPDSIIFIEDAESILLKRENTDHGSSVANLLNMSDGILGDAMRMHIVCTFNTDLMDIDPALRRPGRLIGEMEFKRLTVEKSSALLLELGKEPTNKEMTLGEIYNEDHSVQETKRKVGFIQD